MAERRLEGKLSHILVATDGSGDGAGMDRQNGVLAGPKFACKRNLTNYLRLVSITSPTEGWGLEWLLRFPQIPPSMVRSLTLQPSRTLAGPKAPMAGIWAPDLCLHVGSTQPPSKHTHTVPHQWMGSSTRAFPILHSNSNLGPCLPRKTTTPPCLASLLSPNALPPRAQHLLSPP